MWIGGSTGLERFQDIWIDGLLTGRLKEVDWFKVQTHAYSSNKPLLWKYNIRNDFKYIKWKIRRVCQFCCWNRGGKCWTNKIDRSFQFAKLITETVCLKCIAVMTCCWHATKIKKLHLFDSKIREKINLHLYYYTSLCDIYYILK